MDRAQFERWVFLLNVLGVIYDPTTKQILIGKRENDPYITELSRTFPGGRPAYQEDLEFYLQHEIQIKTWLDVDVKNIIFAKTYPEKREFLAIYYLCEIIWGEIKAGEKFSEVKRIKPTDVQKYFTTSLHPKVLEYLRTLE